MTKSMHAVGTEVLPLDEVDRTRADLVGGKAANLGELSRLAGIRVPAGFCVTTAAFRRVVGGAPAIRTLLDHLASLTAGDRDAIRARCGELRRTIEATAIPDDLQATIVAALTRLGADDAYAVRSSATAEDLPGASFAGQHDTHLDVRGAPAIVQHVRRCWASLFSERAVTYRIQHGFDHREVHMAVLVQRMVLARAAGLVFTADPVTANRKVTAIEAGLGLGEALVAGLTSADRYRVRDGHVIERAIARKTLATRDDGREPRTSHEPALGDAQVLELERLGRRIEAHLAGPQDIEWCLADDGLHIVQSRPITTLYPIPAATDAGFHVYVSVGQQQMMTDAMKPLGLSVFRMTSGRHMHAAGGRLFVDTTRQLAAPASREALLDVLGRSDPRIADALRTIVARGDLDEAPADAPTTTHLDPGKPAAAFAGAGAPDEAEPAIVATLIERSQAALAATRRDLQTRTGPALFDFIRDDLQRLMASLFAPANVGVVMAGMRAAWWINDHMLAWLGEKHVADTLSQSLTHNVTSEMGLALLAVADVIRPYPAVVAHLERVQQDDFLDGLAALDGGREASAAIRAWLDKYGMRCPGEIDITRPRWSERPTALLPMILGNIRNFAPGAGERRFAHGQQEASRRAQALEERLLRLPDGEQKARETRRMIDRLRSCSGYREYPKYVIVRHYFVYRQALLREAGRLVQAGVIADVGDIDYLSFDELREVVRTHRLDDRVVHVRRAEHALHEKLTPPRVITSDGEIMTGASDRSDRPPGALVGVAVSAGVVEGRARVVLDMASADLAPGDILVTAFTDPSWTPLFVAIAGVVTEAGGLMTHGAVIAREYGLPAVVGVEHATRRIRDGQTIRVHGTDGYVEIVK